MGFVKCQRINSIKSAQLYPFLSYTTRTSDSMYIKEAKAFKDETCDVINCYGNQNILFLPKINTSAIENFNTMFYYCKSLVILSPIDARNGKYFSSIFRNCESLDTIEKLIFNQAKTSQMDFAFYQCNSLRKIIIEGTIKVDSNVLDLSHCSKLTVDSLMSFINAFEDNTGEETQYTVTIGATNLAKLTADQIAVATNKNILLA